MLCIVGLDNKLYKMHGTYIKIKKTMTDISPHRPLYVTLKTIGTTVCSHNSSMRYRFRFEDRKLNNFLVVKPSVPVIPYFLSRKSVSLCQYEYLN